MFFSLLLVLALPRCSLPPVSPDFSSLKITSEHASAAEQGCTEQQPRETDTPDGPCSLDVTRANEPVLLIVLCCPLLKLKTAAKALNLHASPESLCHTDSSSGILANAEVGSL